MSKHLNQMTKEALIIGNGSFPRHEIPLRLLSEAEFRICCDGAIAELDAHGIVPDVIIGDLDSIPVALKEKYKHLLIHIADQDTNDQTKAVRYAYEQGFEKVTIIAATGKRDDHTLGNISLLSAYNEYIEVSMATNYGIFTPFSGSRSFGSFPGQQISLFSQTPDKPVSSEGLKYSLQELCLKQWWMGTLNEAVSDTFTIHCSDVDMIVFREYGENSRECMNI